MSREKSNYRETLAYLQEKGFEFLMSKSQAAEKLCISRPTLDGIIKSGRITMHNGKIPLGSIASYLCGD